MSSWNNPVQDTVLPSTNPYGNYTVVDTVPENMLHMVHAHWYQFPPMNPLWYGLLGFWMTVMGTLSVAESANTANLLVVNLAISDFFMITMTPPLLVNAYWGTWILGAFFCEVYAFLGSFFGCVSIWSMVFITATDTTSSSYLYVYSVWVYLFPLAYIIYSYTFIVKAVAAHEKGMREQAKKMGVKSLRSEEAQKTSAECRLCKANAVYNPIVYAISHPKYRAALEKKLPCLACATDGRDGGSDAVSTTTTEASEKTESA
ncbi:rhodopsin [Penaeus vannamei]|uniref:Rhodopsin n=1 Tax=Penaeus vannamei TaxID=6689 RepID=A0A423SYD8_PENVA|nr:rhodopsin [Penaeus vannamei]